MRKIVVSYSSNYLPVIKALAQQEQTEFYTLHPDFTRQLVDMDIPAKQLGEGIDVPVRDLAFRHAAKILIDTCNTMPQIIQTVDGQLLTLHPAVEDFIKHGLPGFLYARLSELAGTVIALDATKPDLIILHNDVEPATRAIALWAKAHSVPCLHVPHAVYIDDFGRGEPGTDVHDLVTASDIAVAGPYQNNWYLTRGGQTHVTGLPQFDKWSHIKVDRVFAKSLFNLSPARPAVMYFSSWRQDTNLLGCHGGVEESYDNFLDAVSEMPDLQVVIKTHPRGGNLQYHIDRAKEKGVACLVTDIHLELLLQAVDVLVAYGPSNTLLDAAHFSHLALASIAGFPHDAEIITMGESKEAMKTGLERALSASPPNWDWFRYKYAGVSDGLAYQRIAELGQELCRASS